MVDCRGCGRKRLKRSGIAQHCSKSNNPQCKAYLAQLRSAVSGGRGTKKVGKTQKPAPESSKTSQ
jgi:hypothetical protein